MHILLHIGGGAPGAKYAHAYCAHIGGGGRCILTLTAYAIGVHIDPLKSAYLAKGKVARVHYFTRQLTQSSAQLGFREYMQVYCLRGYCELIELTYYYLYY